MTGPRMYVIGPYTQGDVALNVRAALALADQLATAGYCPYVPHLTHFWHLCFPRPYTDWLWLDQVWLRLCDACIRLPGPSAGGDHEEALAETLGMPVYRSLEALQADLPVEES